MNQWYLVRTMLRAGVSLIPTRSCRAIMHGVGTRPWMKEGLNLRGHCPCDPGAGITRWRPEHRTPFVNFTAASPRLTMAQFFLGFTQSHSPLLLLSSAKSRLPRMRLGLPKTWSPPSQFISMVMVPVDHPTLSAAIPSTDEVDLLLSPKSVQSPCKVQQLVNILVVVAQICCCLFFSPVCEGVCISGISAVFRGGPLVMRIWSPENFSIVCLWKISSGSMPSFDASIPSIWTPTECAVLQYVERRPLFSTMILGHFRFICASGTIISFLETLKNSAVSGVWS